MAGFMCAVRDYEAGNYELFMNSGLEGSYQPGKGNSCSEVAPCWGQAHARAVVDDFGNLCIVGSWE